MPRQARRNRGAVAGVLLAGILCSAGAARTAFDGGSVELRDSDGHMCFGVDLGGRVLLPWHCINDEQNALASEKAPTGRPRSGPRNIVIRMDGHDVPISASELDGAVSAPMPGVSALGANSVSDFAYLVLPGSQQTFPVSFPADPKRGDSVWLLDNDSQPVECTIQTACGSEFSYTCSPHPRPGWSGGPVRANSPSGPVIGLHRRGDGDNGPMGYAVSVKSILARSTFLYSQRDAGQPLRNQVYSSAFSKPWRAAACTPPKNRLRLIRKLPGAGGGALVSIDKDRFVSVSRAAGKICLQTLGGASQCSPFMRELSGTAQAAKLLNGTIAVFGNEGPKLSFVDTFNITSDIQMVKSQTFPKNGSLTSASSQDTSEDLLIGTTLGLCELTQSGCERVAGIAMDVKSIVRVSQSRYLVLGSSDAKHNRLGCKVVEGRRGAWKVQPCLNTEGGVFSGDGKLVAGGWDHDRIIAGRDTGSFVHIAITPAAAVVTPVAMETLGFKFIDDVVRGWGPVDNGIVVISSDGSARVFSLAQSPGGKPNELAMTDTRIFAADLGVYATRLATGPDWLAAATSEGDVWEYRITSD
jgi:hypothetical protein